MAKKEYTTINRGNEKAVHKEWISFHRLMVVDPRIRIHFPIHQPSLLSQLMNEFLAGKNLFKETRLRAAPKKLTTAWSNFDSVLAHEDTVVNAETLSMEKEGWPCNDYWLVTVHIL